MLLFTCTICRVEPPLTTPTVSTVSSTASRVDSLRVDIRSIMV